MNTNTCFDYGEEEEFLKRESKHTSGDENKTLRGKQKKSLFVSANLYSTKQEVNACAES